MAGELIQDHLNEGEGNEFDDFLVPLDEVKPVEEKNEYDDFIVDIEGAKQTEAKTNLYNAKDTNPDQSAKAYDLSDKTGLPHDTVERNFDQVSKDVTNSERGDLVSNSTSLQNYLAKPENAKLSSDDLGVLDAIGKSINDFWTWGTTPQTEAQAEIAAMSPEERMAFYFRQDDINDPVGKGRAALAEAVRTIGIGLSGSGEMLESSARQLDQLLTGGANKKAEEGTLAYYTTPSTWLQEAGAGAKYVADKIDIPHQDKTYGTKAIGAAGQIFTQALTTMANPQLGMTMLFAMGADQQADDYRLEDDPDSLRDMKIVLGALGTGVSEKLSLDFLMRKLPPEARGGVMNFLKDKLASGGVEATQEVLENMWHDLVRVIGHDPQGDIFDWDNLWESARVAFGGAVTFRTLFETMLPGRARGGHTVAAEARVDKYKNLKDQVLESKTFERHKGKFEEYVDTVVEDSTDPNVYFDAENIDTFFQSREESPEAVMQQLGISPEQYGQAVSSGSDIKVPLSKFLTLADSEYYDPMLQDIRTNQGDETLREAQVENQAQAKKILDESKRILAESEKVEELQAQATEVRDLVKSQLVNTGKFDQNIADQYAALHEAFAITLSSKLGVTPMEAYQRAAGIRVQAGTAESAAQTGEVFSQPDDLIPADIPGELNKIIDENLPAEPEAKDDDLVLTDVSREIGNIIGEQPGEVNPEDLNDLGTTDIPGELNRIIDENLPAEPEAKDDDLVLTDIAGQISKILEGEPDTYFQQAERNHMRLWSAVEQAALDINLPGWKAKPKVILTDEERARMNELSFRQPPFTSTADPEYQEYQALLKKFEAELPTAPGQEIWSKISKTPGVKKEELQWLGLEDYLKSKKKFTRDEVVSFVSENGVIVDENLADEERTEEWEGFNWQETIDDDSENWQYRVEDYENEFDNSSDGDFYFFDVSTWFENNVSVTEMKGRFEEDIIEDLDEDEVTEWNELDSVQETIDFLEAQSIDMFDEYQDDMRDDFIEAAEEAAETEYMDNPIKEYYDEGTEITIKGNDDFGYSMESPSLAMEFLEAYSFSEAEIRATDHAYDYDLVPREDEENEQQARWAEYITNVPESSADNYRELKLTLPEIEGKGSEDSFYYDVHFPDRNVVAFLRLDDRTLEGVKDEGADYNSTYFIEEFQSDWHQQGRQSGYQTGEFDPGELDAQADDLRYNAQQKILTAFDSLKGKYELKQDETIGGDGSNIYIIKDKTGKAEPKGMYLTKTYFFRISEELLRNDGVATEATLRMAAEGDSELALDIVTETITMSPDFSDLVTDYKEIERLLEQAKTERDGVLDAPFKGDSWLNLGLKRAIVDAVENGYDSIAWADANVLVDRWSDRYRTLYETQYDKKMPSAVKKLVKVKPEHRTFSGEPIQSYDEVIKNYEVRQVERDGAERYAIFKNGQNISPGSVNEYSTRERAEQDLHHLVGKKISQLGYWIIPLTDELKQKIKDDGFALFQKNEDAKGQIQFPGRGQEAVVTLFESSDLSTFLHESGHFFLQAYRDLAPESPELQKDLDALLDWMGVPDASMIGIEEHEMFARAFEAYLFEGKAPNTEIQSLFDRFRSWLINVYKQISNLNVTLNDEVRGVMDRMLATEEAIAEAQRVMELLPVYDSAEAAGMTEEEYEDYARSYERATNAAQRDADAELLARAKREQQKAWKEERDTIKAEVLEELYAVPAHQARWFFMRGKLPSGDDIPGIKPVKLSREALIEMYGDDETSIWKDLPFGKYAVWTKEGGIHPDEIASVFGFANGDEMVHAMVEAKGNLNKMAQAEADQRMRTKYGDPDSSEAIAALAMEVIQNQERSNFLSVELKALEKRAGLARTPRNVIKRAAIRIINGTRVSDIRPGTYLRASNKWARRSVDLATAGKFEEAADAKRKQLLNMTIYQEANKAHKYIDVKVRFLNKFVSPGVRKNLARDYLDQIDSILEAYDLKKSTTLKEVERRKALSDWIASQVEQGLEVLVPSDIIEKANQRSYKDLPFEEFEGLVDSVANIEHIARFKQQLIVKKQKRDFNELIHDLIDVAAEHNTWKEQKIGLKTDLDRTKAFGREFLASHVKMEFLLQQLDGNVPDGPWWNSVFRPIAEAEDNEIILNQEYMHRLNNIFERYGSKGRAGLYKETLSTTTELGRNIKRAELISIALNWGNEGNRKALLEGEDWTDANVKSVLDKHMTEQDWGTVQQTWDLIDGLWPQISHLQKELTGVVPAKVEAAPIETKFGTMKGGYYPLQYDVERNIKAFKYEEKMTVSEMFGGNYTQPSTRKGHTIERVGSAGMAVRLDLDVIGTHLTNVIHDLTHRKAILQADHILQDKRVAEAIIAITSREMYQHIRPWLAGIASDKRPFSGWLEQTVNRLRRGATAVNMGWKFTTAIVQPLGYLQSVELLGEKYALKGLKAFYGNPTKAGNQIEFVFNKSTMMANRSKTFDRDIRDSVRRIKGDTLHAKIQRSLFSHIGFMDYSVSIPTWLGAYEQSMDKQRAEGKAISEADAIAYADSVVRMSQSAGGAKDLAAIQRGSDIQRAFTMFYSYFSVLHNLIRRRAQKSGKKGLTAANVTETTMSMLYLVVLPAVLAELIVGRGPDEDEDEEFMTWAATTSAAYPFMTMVGVRDFANALATGYTYQATPLLDAADSFIDAGNSLGDLATDFTGLTEDEFDRQDTKNIMMSTGYLFALPARQLHISGEHLYSVLNDEEDFSLYEFLYRNRRE